MTASPLVHAILYWSFVVCLVYLAAVYVVTVVLLAYAIIENMIRRRESRSEDYDTLAISRFTIPVSVIAPCYNEEVMCVPAVRSLLGLDYPDFEVIVVNDGSEDRTLEVLKKEFELGPHEIFYKRSFETEEVRAIYKSLREPRLIVVDKENGGKADALNCGVNLARYRYLCCIDGDTVYERDALLKGMRLVVKDPATIVGVTSLLAISKHPEAESGELGAKTVDRHLLSNYQHLDYMRSFLNSRLAWSRLDFMLCAIGAFAIWRRDVVHEVGGFSRDFTCEDIEITFRIYEKYLREGKACKVLSLPDIVAKTEGPDRIRRLVSQRARWQRVIMETCWHYREMFANPRYRTVGLLGLPYYFLSEFVAPIFQTISVATLILAAAVGLLDWVVFLLFVGIIGFSTGLATNAALILQDSAFRYYDLRHIVRLMLVGPLDIILYRPILFYAQAKGVIDFLRGEKRWHKFERNKRAPVS